MKSSLIAGVVLAMGATGCFTAQAQSGSMRVPMVPQAIEMHMQQKRTLEQREAIEAKATAAERSPEQSSPENPATKKAKRKRSKPPATSAAG